MATQAEILGTVGTIVAQLYDIAQEKVKGQSRVSREDKESIASLMEVLDQLHHQKPLPTLSNEHLLALRALADSLKSAETDTNEARSNLEGLVEVMAPAPTYIPLAAAPLSSPLNTRMLLNLHQFSKGITSARLRLMNSNEDFDRAAYKEARNAYKLAYEALKPRLEKDAVAATVEQNTEFETEMLAPLSSVNGANFPQLVRRAADFVRTLLFGPNAIFV